MLYVLFGRENCTRRYILDSRLHFTWKKKPEWFEDKFVQKFLFEIDGSRVLFQEALVNRWGKGISTEKMSTGCKTLCCIYYDTENLIFNGTNMGDNCVPFLIDIARKKDVTIFLEHYMDIPRQYFEEGLIADTFGRVLGEYDFDDMHGDWCQEMDRDYMSDEEYWRMIDEKMEKQKSFMEYKSDKPVTIKTPELTGFEYLLDD